MGTLYVPTYIFAIWDSYRTTIDMNSNYILASREDAVIKQFTIGAMEINYLDKRKPWVSAIWSTVIPGMGQLYTIDLLLHFLLLLGGLLLCINQNVLWQYTLLY